MSRPLLVNVGCGSVFHPDWENLDAQPAAPQVRRHDVRAGLPYGAGAVDAVYASHVLEHLAPDGAAQLVRECLRVLKPGGIARFAVPDLETIARLYLRSLEEAFGGDAGAAWRYDWALLELYDQAVRTRSGGRMAAFLRGPLTAEERRFVAGRVGEEVVPSSDGKSRSDGTGAVKRRLWRLRTLAARWFAMVFLGRQGAAALEEGLFRRGGEVHQWMYDRFSMTRLLEGAGFTGIRICRADESAIAGFPSFELDTLAGRPRKPDSLYIEARKRVVG